MRIVSLNIFPSLPKHILPPAIVPIGKPTLRLEVGDQFGDIRLQTRTNRLWWALMVQIATRLQQPLYRSSHWKLHGPLRTGRTLEDLMCPPGFPGTLYNGEATICTTPATVVEQLELHVPEEAYPVVHTASCRITCELVHQRRSLIPTSRVLTACYREHLTNPTSGFFGFYITDWENGSEVRQAITNLAERTSQITRIAQATIPASLPVPSRN